MSLSVFVLMPSLQTTLWKIIARGVSFAVTALQKETKEGKIYFSELFFSFLHRFTDGGKLLKRLFQSYPSDEIRCLSTFRCGTDNRG